MNHSPHNSPTEKFQEVLDRLNDEAPQLYFVDYEPQKGIIKRLSTSTLEEAKYHAMRFAKLYGRPVQINRALIKSKITTKIEFFNMETRELEGVEEV
jgi:hypothetical protein